MSTQMSDLLFRYIRDGSTTVPAEALREAVAEIEKIKRDYTELHIEAERLRADNAKLRAQRSEFDCRFAGNVADISGSHCPVDEPCLRCQNERLRAVLQEVEQELPGRADGWIGECLVIVREIIRRALEEGLR